MTVVTNKQLSFSSSEILYLTIVVYLEIVFGSR